MGEKFNEVYNNMISAYKRKGKIGKVKPYDLEHAKKIAWTIATKIINNNKNKNNKNTNTTDWLSSQGTGPLTGYPICCQLKLF